MIDKAVHVSLLIHTDDDPATVQLAVLAALSDQHAIVSTSVSAIGAEDDPDPYVQAVVCPVRGLLRMFVDEPEAAEAFAREEHAVLIAWLVDEDHRGQST